MWVIFLLSAMSVAICMLGIVYIANRIIIAIQKEQEELKQENLNNKEN